MNPIAQWQEWQDFNNQRVERHGCLHTDRQGGNPGEFSRRGPERAFCRLESITGSLRCICFLGWEETLNLAIAAASRLNPRPDASLGPIPPGTLRTAP
jgi:hypothetical protein